MWSQWKRLRRQPRPLLAKALLPMRAPSRANRRLNARRSGGADRGRALRGGEADIADADAHDVDAHDSERAAAEGADAAPQMIEVWTLQRHSASVPRRHEGGGRHTPRAETQTKPLARLAGSVAGEPPLAAGQEGGRAANNRPRADKGGFRAGGKPGQGPRPEQRADARGSRDDGRRNRPSGAFSPPEKRERQPDPDSPFAKLLALKAELEKKGKA